MDREDGMGKTEIGRARYDTIANDLSLFMEPGVFLGGWISIQDQKETGARLLSAESTAGEFTRLTSKRIPKERKGRYCKTFEMQSYTF
jgi:hypothetical protein